MRNSAIIALALVAIVGADKSSSAAPISARLTLTTDSGVDLFLNIQNGAITASVPFDLVGTLDIQVEDALTSPSSNDTTGLAFLGADIALSDRTIDISAGIFGGIEAEISGAEINSLSSNGYIPLNSTNGSLPFEYTFDPSGGSPTELSLDEGLFTYMGTGALTALIGSGTLDFATNPINAELGPVGQIGMVTQDIIISDGDRFITVSAPITFGDALVTDPVQVDAMLSGVIVATGRFSLIPEPSSAVLLGIAMIGFIPLWRRLHGTN